MTALFTSIDLETGDLTQFSSTATGTDYTLAASSSAPKNGTYGLRATATSASDSGAEAHGEKSFSSSGTAETVIDAWFRFSSWTGNGYGSDIAKSIMVARNSGVGMLYWLAVRGTRLVELCLYNTSFASAATGLTITLAANTWYLIRVIHNSSGSLTLKYSTDGTNFTTVGTYSTAVQGTKADSVRVGVCHVNQWEQAQYTVDVDDLAAYDAEPVGSTPITASDSGALSESSAVAVITAISASDSAALTDTTTSILQTTLITAAGSSTYTTQSYQTTIDSVELWGGGGAGGQCTTNTGGGGGGGGAYAKSTAVPVSPSTGYTVVVGAAGTTGASPVNGGNSTFASTTVVAEGGKSTPENTRTGSAGGLASNSTGATKFSGGSGFTSVTSGGGGGGSGGTAANGNTATSGTGAAAVTGGGPGGDGKTVTQGNGSAPVSGPGGGGGGGYRSTSGTRTGGAGWAGQAKIIYTYVPSTTTPIAASDSATLTEGASALSQSRTDSGILSEASAIAATPATSDAATLSESNTLLASLTPATDQATLTEGASSLVSFEPVTATDQATLAEASQIAATLTTSDSATESESSTSVPAVAATDTATLTEAINLTPSGRTDDATLGEASSIAATIAASDSGTLGEANTINTGSTPFASDLLTLGESPFIAATLATADAATLSDAGDLLVIFAGSDSGSLQDTSQIESTSARSDDAALSEQSAIDASNEAADAFLMQEEASVAASLTGDDSATLDELTDTLEPEAVAVDLFSLGEASELFAELVGVDAATLGESSQIDAQAVTGILAQDFFALTEATEIIESDGGLNIIAGTGTPSGRLRSRSGASLQGRAGAATTTRAGEPALTSRRIE